MKQEKQIFLVTRDGQPDRRYYKALERKYTTAKLKRAGTALFAATRHYSFWLYCKVYDDCYQTNYLAQYFPPAARGPQARNHYGQFARN